MRKINFLNLVREISITDFKLKYQGSMLGFFWSLLKPLMLFGVLFFVFTRVFRIGGSIPNYSVYLLLGIVLWTFFAETTSVCMGSIASKGELIRKIYFPRIILVIANSATAFLTLLLNLLVVFGFMFFLKVDVSYKAVFFPFLLLEYYILILGISFFLSSLFVKFKDIGHIWEVVSFALFYASAILYPLSLVKGITAKILVLSPVVQVIQDARYLLVTRQAERAVDLLRFPYILIPYLLPFIIFVFGYLIFQKQAAKFAENV